MLRTIEQTRNVDAEAVLLARVYRLILNWRDDDNTDELRLKEKTDAPAQSDAAPREGGEDAATD
jgi:hypothetical protein